jgi:uncharacterized protein (DUF2252 family)
MPPHRKRLGRIPGPPGSLSRQAVVPPRSRAEQRAAGKALRDTCPRDAHAVWKASKDRRDPLDTVLAAEKGRMPDLLPLRHGRMARSPFTFYRGSALAMAADLASTPTSGIRVQCCGDAHLSNFGAFGTPERKVIFSVNDLDETLPAPWEWDVKRLAASFVVASRDNGLKDAVGSDAARTCVRSYREAMAEFSDLRTLELFYLALPADDLVASAKASEAGERAARRLEKGRAHSIAEDIFPKLAEQTGKMPVIKDQLPTIFHHEDFPPGKVLEEVLRTLAGYRETLSPAYQTLLDRYELRDAAIKVVGIGSVGTACFVLLFTAGDSDPLFLQFKEARASVLETYVGTSRSRNHGQRVVNGCRIMQPASDIFLGWAQGPRRQFFVRQLRDIKISALVETFGRTEMDLYASWCGRALALAHARSGSPTMLSGYMGKTSGAFDKAIAAFSLAYADQNEKDHAALARAIKKGTLKAVFEDDT